ncbi:MAG: hypothetical protein GY769_18435 [bacterium]|nr:hypothetical protein [bacterium]
MHRSDSLKRLGIAMVLSALAFPGLSQAQDAWGTAKIVLQANGLRAKDVGGSLCIALDPSDQLINVDNVTIGCTVTASRNGRKVKGASFEVSVWAGSDGEVCDSTELVDDVVWTDVSKTKRPGTAEFTPPGELIFEEFDFTDDDPDWFLIEIEGRKNKKVGKVTGECTMHAGPDCVQGPGVVCLEGPNGDIMAEVPGFEVFQADNDSAILFKGSTDVLLDVMDDCIEVGGFFVDVTTRGGPAPFTLMLTDMDTGDMVTLTEPGTKFLGSCR